MQSARKSISHDGSGTTLPSSHWQVFFLDVVQQNGDWGTQRHVVDDLLGANAFVVSVLHEDGQEALGLPRNLLGLRGQNTDAADVLEAELFTLGRHRRAGLVVSLGREEGVDVLSLVCDEDAHVSFAVVAHLARAAGVPHGVARCDGFDRCQYGNLQKKKRK